MTNLRLAFVLVLQKHALGVLAVVAIILLGHWLRTNQLELMDFMASLIVAAAYLGAATFLTAWGVRKDEI